MAMYPKVEKRFSRLSQDDGLRGTTIQLETPRILALIAFLGVLGLAVTVSAQETWRNYGGLPGQPRGLSMGPGGGQS